MSESADELATAVRAVAESLAEAVSSAGRLGEHATELSEEAAGHGWGGIGDRMREAAEALEASVVSLGNGQQACQGAVTALGLINDQVPAGEVAGHLSATSAQLGEAVIEVAAGVAKIAEAQEAVTEIGQQGMMQATSDLHAQATELHERIVEQQGASESEQAGAEAYAKRLIEELYSSGGNGSPTPPLGNAAPKQIEDVQGNPYGGDGTPSVTLPAGPPDLDARPQGIPAKWTARDNDETVRGRGRENESAKIMAKHGYDVEQNPIFRGSKNPDYRIEGKIFDHLAPAREKSCRNIFSAVRDKVDDDQTRRAIINLDDSGVTVDQLRKQFADWSIPGLEEVIAVKAGKVYGIFPNSIDGEGPSGG